MGFSKEDVINALKFTGNNYADACKLLMRTHNNYNDGLLKDSPMLKALIISPHIQLSFSSPKIFIGNILSLMLKRSIINNNLNPCFCSLPLHFRQLFIDQLVAK